jgi:SAM-dependent methyltransferase
MSKSDNPPNVGGSSEVDPRYAKFPAGFFDRMDSSDDARFYDVPRIVTHIDGGAIAAVGAIYDQLELHLRAPVLDLMSSWISHFQTAPEQMTALGMNAAELLQNEQATDWVVHDLNANPVLPFGDGSFAAACCAVSVDYLARPLEVFDDLARVLQPGSPFVCTFSNRCFPTKVIAGWMSVPQEHRPEIVATYFKLSPGWAAPQIIQWPNPSGQDPLWAVWSTTV